MTYQKFKKIRALIILKTSILKQQCVQSKDLDITARSYRIFLKPVHGFHSRNESPLITVYKLTINIKAIRSLLKSLHVQIFHDNVTIYCYIK